MTLQLGMLSMSVCGNSIFYAWCCPSSAYFEKCRENYLWQTGLMLLLGDRDIIIAQPCDKVCMHKALSCTEAGCGGPHTSLGQTQSPPSVSVAWHC